jgi:2-C-methyl-D-erythritol 4-phosphate cytidylyltransferase
MNKANIKYFAIVPAAGNGARMQHDTPKQYLMLDGKPVLQHTLEKLQSTGLFERIILVLSMNDDQGERIARKFDNVQLALGGEQRFDSVYSGMQVLSKYAESDDFVFVHDAARPCVAASDIIKLQQAIIDDPVGGTLGCPVRDTLKVVSQHKIERTLDRSKIWHALTPQAFRYAKLLQAMQIGVRNKNSLTDEASCMEQVGLSVKMVEGRSDNIKITYVEDLKVAEDILCV